MVITFFAGIAYPNYEELNVDTAFIDIVNFVGGTWLTVLTNITLILSFGIATCQASQAAVARILFAMGRDGVLPKNLGHISEKYQTPDVATIFVGLVTAPVALFCSLGFITTLVSFGALFGFILLNVAVVWKFFIQDKESKKDGKAVLYYLICPLIGLVVTIWIFINLGAAAHTIGFVWLAAGFMYLLAVTKGFRNPVPQMEMS